MLRLAANLSTMFTEWPLLDRPAAAAEAGFDAIEFQFPYGVSLERLADSVKRAGVETVLINAPAGRLERGELGLACLPDRDADFRAALAQALETARALACPRVHCLAGNLSEPGARWSLLVDQIRYAAEFFASEGLETLIEPLNNRDHPAYALNTLAAADALLGEIAHPRLKLQFDAYHARANGEDVLSAFALRRARIGHVQISDFPGRVEPGAGDIDFPAFFAGLETLGYTGWIGCEYRPAGATRDSLAWRSALLQESGQPNP